MYKLDVYKSARQYFWSYIVSYNPLLFLLWPVTFFMLLIQPRDELFQRRVFILFFCSSIITCLIFYKQIFPYYMLTTLPAFLLLYAEFFTWLHHLFTRSFSLRFVDKSGLWALIVLYLFGLVFINFIAPYPMVYLLIGWVPIFLGLYSSQPSTSIIKSILVALLLVGLIFPGIYFVKSLPQKNGNYQKSMMYLTDILLKQGGEYLAGIELAYDKNQPIEGLRHLDVTQLVYLYSPSKKLEPAMMSSLNHAAVTQEQALKNLMRAPIKFYVNNYRIYHLPPALKSYLDAEFVHLWGSIYLYAPRIVEGKKIFYLKFNGNYKILSKEKIKLNGKIFKPYSVVSLKSGKYISLSSGSYRLSLLPQNVESYFDKNNEQDQWEKMFG